jgi:DNA processing protein
VAPVEARAAVALWSVDGVGPVTYRRLVDGLGSAEQALEAAAPDLMRLGRVPRRVARRINRGRLAAADAILESVPPDSRVIVYGSVDYPPALERLYHPPPVLFVTGPLSLDPERSVAIVGTRRASEYGRRMASRIARGLSEAGWTVVSGLARGIDGEAHRAALEGPGSTVAVLGHGLRHEYPASHRPLFRAIRRRGLLVSEFAPDLAPEPGLFPRRNRIIAALSRAVVVVQAGRKSGALITAEHATDIHRDVLAVPGPVGPEGSRGVHDLIRDGAGLVTSAEDVLACLGTAAPAPPIHAGPGYSDREGEPGRSDPILRALADGPLVADDVACRAGIRIPATLSRLGLLELDGSVRALPGGRYEAT